MTSKSTRIGFIGASKGASWADGSHIPYLKSSRNQSYTVTALQNSSKASAEKNAAAFELPDAKAFYDNPKDIANDPNVDLVAVSIKVPDHYAAIMSALQAGKDIFVEWPLAANLKDAEEVTQLAKEKGVRSLVGLQARQNPSIIAVKKMIDNGELGDILGTTMHGYGIIFGPTSPEQYGYMYPISAGANLLTIPCGHAIDALCWVLGELGYVSATLANRRPTVSVVNGDGKVVGEAKKEVHDVVSINGELEKGGVVNVVYEGGMNPVGGPSFFWQINGTKGSVVLEGEYGHVQMFQPKVKFAKTGEEAKDVDVKWVGSDFSHGVGEAWDALAGKGDGHLRTHL